MYPMGWPLWKLLARMGVPVIIKINVIHDTQAGVYTATSPNLPGLVTEADSKAALIEAVYDCIDLLMEPEHSIIKHRPLAAWSGELLAA